MKNREKKRRRKDRTEGGPQHTKFIMLFVFILFCYNNWKKGIESIFSKKSNFDLYKLNIKLLYLSRQLFFKLDLKLVSVPRDFISNGIEFHVLGRKTVGKLSRYLLLTNSNL